MKNKVYITCPDCDRKIWGYSFNNSLKKLDAHISTGTCAKQKKHTEEIRVTLHKIGEKHLDEEK